MKSNAKGNIGSGVSAKELFSSQKRLVLLHPSGEYTHGTSPPHSSRKGRGEGFADGREERAGGGKLRGDTEGRVRRGLQLWVRGHPRVRGGLGRAGLSYSGSSSWSPVDPAALPQTPHLLLRLPPLRPRPRSRRPLLQSLQKKRHHPICTHPF